MLWHWSVQYLHGHGLVLSWVVYDSAYQASTTFLSCPIDQFLTGRLPLASNSFVAMAVPWILMLWSYGFALSTSATRAPISLFNSASFLGSATSHSLLPRTATPFRFLEPITAPRPHRPANDFRPVPTPANFTSRSPPTPIVAVSKSLPRFSRTQSSTSSTFLPHRCEASMILTSSSSAT